MFAYLKEVLHPGLDDLRLLLLLLLLGLQGCGLRWMPWPIGQALTIAWWG